jgi:hypothetical protein
LNGQDTFESEIPLEHIDILLDLGGEYGFDPTSSIEMESYFAALISDFSGPEDGLNAWLKIKVREEFCCVAKSPVWIQNPDWQLEAGRPMWFVGQLDVHAARGVFHDDASFYIFWNHETGNVRGVIQVS